MSRTPSRSPLTAAIVTVAVAAAALVVPASPASAAPGPGTPGAQLEKQTITLTASHRTAQMPAAAQPYRQFERVEVERSLGDTEDWVTVRVRLRAAPPGQWYDHDAQTLVGLGHVDSAGVCQIGVVAVERTNGGSQPGEQHYYLGERDYVSRIGARPTRPFTCVGARLASPDGTQVHDDLTGDLVNRYAAPALSWGKVSLLGTSKKKVSLVKGVWTPYDVTVRNTGTLPVSKLTLTGSGKGLKVRRATSTAELAPGRSTTLRLQVRHTGRAKKATLRLKVAAPGGVTARRSVKVVRTAAPRRPVDGRYVGAGGRVHFRITKGRVTGFSATVTTRCEATNDQQQTLDFGRVKVPRHGIVVASRSGRASGARWTTGLQLRAVGTKVTRGRFTHHVYTPGLAGSSCSSDLGFSARRVGR